MESKGTGALTMITNSQRIELTAANLKALLQQEKAIKEQIANCRQELLNCAMIITANNDDLKTILTASGTVTIAEICDKTYTAKVAKLTDKMEEWKAKVAAQKLIEEKTGQVIYGAPTYQLRFKAI